MCPKKSHPYIQIGNSADKLKDIYSKAFKTKYKRDDKDVKQLPAEPNVKELKQWFNYGTWMVDNVNFDGMWFVFFVEANTRFLIIKAGNAALDEIGDNVEVSGGRVQGTKFIEIFRDFLRTERSSTVTIGGKHKTVFARDVKMIIGDSEKAFWTKDMMSLYKSKDIATRILNCKRDGHNGLAILNRIVRTIRDMNYHMGNKTNVTLKQIQRLAEVYNHTYHKSLSDILGGGEKVSPNDVHYNEMLESKIIRNIRCENYLRSEQKGFILDVGTKVFVRVTGDGELFNKRRSPYLDGYWEITNRFGNMYELVNEDGVKIYRSRSALRVVE